MHVLTPQSNAYRVEPDPSGRGLLESEGEGVEHLVGSQPDVGVAPGDDLRSERFLGRLPDDPVDAVRCDDHVGVELGGTGDLVVESQIDTDLGRALRQDVEQRRPRDAVAAAFVGHPLAVQHEVLALPSERALGDAARGLGVGAVQVGEQVVPEHDAPTVGAVLGLALEHRDFVVRIDLLGQDREVQARGATTHANDPHQGVTQRSRRFIRLRLPPYWLQMCPLRRTLAASDAECVDPTTARGRNGRRGAMVTLRGLLDRPEPTYYVLEHVLKTQTQQRI